MPDIVHICYPGIGGQAAVATGLALEGKASGVSQGIIFYGIEEAASQYVQLCDKTGIRHSSVIKKEGIGFAARKELCKVLDQYQPKVVIAHHHDTSITACVRVPGRRAYGVIFVEHHSNALKTRKDWLLSTMAHRLGDHTVYLTSSYRDAVQAKVGKWFNTSKTSIIANGVDLSLYSKSRGSDATSDPFVIGMQGRMDEGKDYDSLIRAFAETLNNTPHTSMILELAGDGPDRTKLETLTTELGVEEQVRFLGFLKHSDLIASMRNWDLAVLSTLGETLSMAILEAWALGLPLIGSDVIGVRDIIHDQQDGCLVKSSCSDALAEAMTTLISNNSLRKQIGLAGRAQVEAHYDRAKNWSSYEQLIAQIYQSLSSHSPLTHSALTPTPHE